MLIPVPAYSGHLAPATGLISTDIEQIDVAVDSIAEYKFLSAVPIRQNLYEGDFRLVRNGDSTLKKRNG